MGGQIGCANIHQWIGVFVIFDGLKGVACADPIPVVNQKRRAAMRINAPPDI